MTARGLLAPSAMKRKMLALGLAVVVCAPVGCGESRRTLEDQPDGDRTVNHGFQPYRCSIGMQAEGCRCEELTSGGPRTCAVYPTPTADCLIERDECCSHEECPGGRCERRSPSSGSCCTDSDCSVGTCNWVDTIGAGYCFEEGETEAYNRCVTDECSSDADCPDGFCTDPGVLPLRVCIPGTCKTDADCARRPGGICTSVAPGCPSCTGNLTVAACVYPDDGCTYFADCPEGSVCEVKDGFAACRPGTCPPYPG